MHSQALPTYEKRQLQKKAKKPLLLIYKKKMLQHLTHDLAILA